MMGPDDLTDEELMAADDAETFGVLYRRHSEAVLAYLLFRTRDAEQALDLTAETFATALAARKRYRPTAGTARGWLFGIAKNVLSNSRRRAASADSMRRKLGMERLSFDDVQLERVDAMIDQERSGPPIERLVGDLPPDQAEAVIARVIDERHYAEISSELDVSEHTVRQRVSRGLARLARLKESSDHA